VECVCGPGDVVFIPNGWWHLAVNLSLSVAVTQNFVSRQNVCSVLRFLKQEGNTELEAAFNLRLQQEHPGLVELIS
jgi:oxalate decarboxylase/phosphoglucose isomerase-like protein (cupin superfamily)